MLFRKSNSPKPSFQTNLGPSLVLGTGVCAFFYGAVIAGPLDFAWLRRYGLCHPVAIAILELFFVAVVALVSKWIHASYQNQLSRMAGLALEDTASTKPESLGTASGEQKALWLDTQWRAQSTGVCESWLGQRVAAILQRQIKRKNTKQLDQDIHEFANRDADEQHNSYGFVRIMVWAMPMLGFLGTVLGISETLGQMDAQALASGSEDAMKSLTRGLYFAFDAIAIGIVLTMVAMLVQFGVNRTEQALLSAIDGRVSETMQLCLTEPERINDTNHVESALHYITQELLQSVQQIVQTQSELWQQTIDTAHGHWQNLTSTSAETLQASLAGAIESALSKHNESLVSHTDRLAKVQTEGADLIDARWQQWQTTLSEQARAVHQQQREMAIQTELMNKLVDKHDAVRSMEMPLQATLERLTDVDRFHDAAICLTEAIAVLGTQMERYGYLGRQPVRRKSEPATDGPLPLSSESFNPEDQAESDKPISLPLKRRAG